MRYIMRPEWSLVGRQQCRLYHHWEYKAQRLWNETRMRGKPDGVWGEHDAFHTLARLLDLTCCWKIPFLFKWRFHTTAAPTDRRITTGFGIVIPKQPHFPCWLFNVAVRSLITTKNAVHSGLNPDLLENTAGFIKLRLTASDVPMWAVRLCKAELLQFLTWLAGCQHRWILSFSTCVVASSSTWCWDNSPDDRTTLLTFGCLVEFPRQNPAREILSFQGLKDPSEEFLLTGVEGRSWAKMNWVKMPRI